MATAQKERGQQQLVELSAIRTDGNTLARERIDHEFVTDYAQAMRDEAVFPPVVLFFDGRDYWPGDGHHRIEAARSLDWAQIDAVVHEGGQREAILHAVGANDQHGNRRTRADKRLAVEILLKDKEWSTWPDRKLAKLARVSHTHVANIREELATLPREAPAEEPLPRKRLKAEREERAEPADDWSPSSESDARDEPEAEIEPVRRPAKAEPKTPLTEAFEAITDVAREILTAVPKEEWHLAADQFRAMGEWLVEQQGAA